MWIEVNYEFRLRWRPWEKSEACLARADLKDQTWRNPGSLQEINIAPSRAVQFPSKELPATLEWDCKWYFAPACFKMAKRLTSSGCSWRCLKSLKLEEIEWIRAEALEPEDHLPVALGCIEGHQVQAMASLQLQRAFQRAFQIALRL